MNDTAKIIADFIKAERNIYVKCPCCNEIYRLNEARIFWGEKMPQDLLDELKEKQLQLQEMEDVIRKDAIQRSLVTYIGKTLENLAPTLKNWGHQPRDCRFLGDPIDFIAFDGLFENRKVQQITFLEVKTGKSKVSPSEKSIKNTIEEKKIAFEEVRLPSELVST